MSLVAQHGQTMQETVVSECAIIGLVGDASGVQLAALGMIRLSLLTCYLQHFLHHLLQDALNLVNPPL